MPSRAPAAVATSERFAFSRDGAHLAIIENGGLRLVELESARHCELPIEGISGKRVALFDDELWSVRGSILDRYKLELERVADVELPHPIDRIDEARAGAPEVLARSRLGDQLVTARDRELAIRPVPDGAIGPCGNHSWLALGDDAISMFERWQAAMERVSSGLVH